VITLAEFEETGALLTGHFRLSSGLHSGGYLQCARLLMWPERAERAGQGLADLLSHLEPRVVASPALGGIVIGHETARALGVRAVFAERPEGRFTFRRGFAFERGEHAVVVEDVFTTGKSTREAMAAVEEAGARVVAVGAIVDRGLSPGEFTVPALSLMRFDVPAWPESECPLCLAGVPIESPGSRHGTSPNPKASKAAARRGRT
jgi:orotate phosphoribosyltransferase